MMPSPFLSRCPSYSKLQEESLNRAKKSNIILSADIIMAHKVNKDSGEVSEYPTIKCDIRNTLDYVAQECKDIGIEAVIQRFNITGDLGLFNQRTPLTGIDFTNLPEKTVEEIYKDIPDELKKGKTYEEFLKTLSREDIETFLKAKQAESQNVVEKGEE